MTTFATLPRSFIHTRVVPRRQQRVNVPSLSPSVCRAACVCGGEGNTGAGQANSCSVEHCSGGRGGQGGPGSLDGLWALAGRWQWRRLRGGS